LVGPPSLRSLGTYPGKYMPLAWLGAFLRSIGPARLQQPAHLGHPAR
jgi:hypothetical protein